MESSESSRLTDPRALQNPSQLDEVHEEEGNVFIAFFLSDFE